MPKVMLALLWRRIKYS